MSTQPPTRIMIVDDEVELMRALCDSLGPLGYQTQGFTSPREALDALAHTDIDILLSDLMMPGMSGLELLRGALEIDRHIVPILMTGQGTVQTAVDAMRTGAFDYVLKPFKLSAITPIIERAAQLRRLRLDNIELRETIAVHELAQTAAGTLHLPAITEKIADAALEQCKADEVSVLLPIEGAGGFKIAAVRGAGREHLLGEVVSMEGTIAGKVARTLEPHLIADAAPETAGGRKGVRHSLSMPMLAGGHLVGVLNLSLTRPAGRPFTPGQTKALNLLVAAAAGAIQNASLYRKAQEAEARYRSLVERMPAVVFMMTLDDTPRTLYISPQAETIMGYTPEKLLADPTSWLSAIHPDDRPGVIADFIEHRRTGEPTIFENRIIKASGETRWLRIHGSSVPGVNGAAGAFLGIAFDITGQKESRQALLRKEEELRQAQKMEAVGRLAAGVAHDFNNLLQAMFGAVQLLAMRADDSPEIKELQTEMSAHVKRGAALTRQLMLFSRREESTTERLEMSSIVRSFSKMLRRLVRENIKLEIATADEPLHFEGDAGQIEQVLMNFAVNASDAMQHGGCLTVRTGTLGDSEIWVEVEDTGTGIPPDVVDHVFEPFFTTKEVGKGTGLGLSVVHGIVAQHGGRVEVKTKLGEGTCFRAVFKRITEETCRTVEAVRCEQATAPKTGARILVVEDEDAARGALVAILGLLRHLPQGVGSAEEAMSLLDHEAFDLILTDVTLPGLSGYQLGRILKEQRPDSIIVFMTGYSDEHPPEGTGVRLLRKPFDPKTLQQAIEEALSHA